MEASTTELREARLSMARDLLHAIQAGDEHGARRSAEVIARAHGSDAWRELERIAGELREVLSSVRSHARACQHDDGEKPDAQMQLRQVIEITENAANSTLTAVEAALPLASGLISMVGSFRKQRSATLTEDRPLATLLERVEVDTLALKAQLSEVLVAQGFQDLTGQIIRRVVELVRELERHVDASGALPRESAPVRSQNSVDRGRGPALPGADEASVVKGQQDVDALLSDMGL